jgi:uncharacterized protein (TIGR03000 family)
MPRTVLVLACLIGLGLSSRPALGQSPRKTILLEILLPEDARLFIEGQDTKTTGSMRSFESPPLPPGKYTYTIKAIVPGPKGPQTITRHIDVRPGDFESIDLRPRRDGERVPDVLYEPTPQEAVEALLDLARLKVDDVLWDLGCGDGRIPVTAARKFGIEARGFEIDPKYLKEARANVQKNGVDKLVAIEDRDIFTLDLSRGPTVITLYLLPSLNAKLLPQLQRLPAGARVLSIGHRLADIPPDQQVTVDTQDGEYTLYLWRVETLRKLSGTAATTQSTIEAKAFCADRPWTSSTRRCVRFRRR